MTLHFIDRSGEVCSALAGAFAQHAEVEMVTGDIKDAAPRYDAIITAGNSFGLMDGGVDQAVNEFFAGDAQRQVQAEIRRYWGGLLPVGAAVTVSLARESGQKCLLIYAPTMIYPGPIVGTPNVYLAAKAAFLDMLEFVAGTTLCPGFGTLTGKVPPASAAAQMELAYRHALNAPAAPEWTTARQIGEAVNAAIFCVPTAAPR